MASKSWAVGTGGCRACNPRRERNEVHCAGAGTDARPGHRAIGHERIVRPGRRRLRARRRRQVRVLALRGCRRDRCILSLLPGPGVHRLRLAHRDRGVPAGILLLLLARVRVSRIRGSHGRHGLRARRGRGWRILVPAVQPWRGVSASSGPRMAVRALHVPVPVGVAVPRERVARTDRLHARAARASRGSHGGRRRSDAGRGRRRHAVRDGRRFRIRVHAVLLRKVRVRLGAERGGLEGGRRGPFARGARRSGDRLLCR